MSWTPSELPSRIGGSIRVRHCSDSRSCKVTRQATGLMWYCFRCPPGENRGWIKDVLPLAQRAPQPDEATRGVLRTEGGEPVPEEYRAWLARFGVGAIEIAAMGLRWSPRDARLLWPVPAVYREGTLMMGRSNTLKPKWLTDWRNTSEGYVPGYRAERVNAADIRHGGPLVCVTEDPISAWKVAQAGFTGVPLVGTRITDTTLQYLMPLRSVVLALDPDYYGQLYESQLEARLKRLGVNVIRPRMAQDPKYIPAPKIAQEILEAL